MYREKKKNKSHAFLIELFLLIFLLKMAGGKLKKRWCNNTFFILATCSDRVQVSLTVDHPQKVLLMGEAQDFGTCKAAKRNGDPCSQIVNLVGPTTK